MLNKPGLTGLLLIMIILTACAGPSPAPLQEILEPPMKPPVELNAADFSITWSLLYATPGVTGFRYSLKLKNDGNIPLAGHDWSIYFNSGYGILPGTTSANVRIEHINGDLFRISPTEIFDLLNPGRTMEITYQSRSLVYRESETPVGYYFVFNESQDGKASSQLIRNIRIDPEITAEQTRRGNSDHMPVPTAKSRYHANKALAPLPANKIPPVLPTPVWYAMGTGSWVLDSTVTIQASPGLEGEAKFLKEALGRLAGIRVRSSADSNIAGRTIILKIADVAVDGQTRTAGSEAYLLAVSGKTGCNITGSDPAGVFYGIQSLLALIPVNAIENGASVIPIQEIQVADRPQFPYRGFMLDVSRNFHSKDQVLKLLDLMATYKLNKFHFHLADDEGWRLEIKPLPELTDVGGRRGHTNDEQNWLQPSFGSGPNPPASKTYYSRADYIEILRFAKSRHIEVIPEFDLPGHARAAIKSMEARYNRLVAAGQEKNAASTRLTDPLDSSKYRSVQGWSDNVVNVCEPSTYKFLEIVFDEVIAIYRNAGAPLAMIHVGGDEVPGGAWKKSPDCEQMIDSTKALSGVEDLPGYFRRRVIKLLADRNLKAAGWQELALEETHRFGKKTVAPNKEFADAVVPYYWYNIWGWGSEDIGYRLANSGFKVVMSCATNLYFDLAYDKHPKEPGLSWAGFVDTRTVYEFNPLDIFKCAGLDRMGNPVDVEKYNHSARLTETGKKNILGIQGQLWSERLTSPDRVEYMAFPKMIALAERAWTKPPGWASIADPELHRKKLDADWNIFVNSLGQRELPRLDNVPGGVAYRIPLPGAVIDKGILKANIAFPGMTIRFTTDGSEPQADSRIFTSPVAVGGVVKLKTFDTHGRSSLTVTLPD